MATTLSEEVRHVQNPALGAFLSWRFACGYSAARNEAPACPVPLLFFPLPMVLHHETFRSLESTRRQTGLRTFAAKFATRANNESDILLSLHDRVKAMRSLSLRSLQIATGAQLLTVDVEAGAAYPLTKTFPKAGVPESIRALAKNAEKLGGWCGELTLLEVSSILKVRF